MKRGWLLGVMAIALSGCTPFTPDFEKNTADVILRITKVTGQAAGGADSSVLFSDVQTCTGGVCTVLPDAANVTLTAIAKNPIDGTVDNNFNRVMLTNYTISYTRTDGRNTEGVDVPFAITGPLGVDVDINGETIVGIGVVRQTAKSEAPLKNLGNGGQQNVVIVMVAHITMYGKTVNEQNVSAAVDLEIHFGDFPNE